MDGWMRCRCASWDGSVTPEHTAVLRTSKPQLARASQLYELELAGPAVAKRAQSSGAARRGEEEIMVFTRAGGVPGAASTCLVCMIAVLSVRHGLEEHGTRRRGSQNCASPTSPPCRSSAEEVRRVFSVFVGSTRAGTRAGPSVGVLFIEPERTGHQMRRTKYSRRHLHACAKSRSASSSAFRTRGTRWQVSRCQATHESL